MISLLLADNSSTLHNLEETYREDYAIWLLVL